LAVRGPTHNTPGNSAIRRASLCPPEAHVRRCNDKMSFNSRPYTWLETSKYPLWGK
jgi:hypothetical protein